jgi:dihydrolipoamide dehydrogenase
MHTRSVDVAIIGAGTAGLNARREVEKRGGRPLLIESGAYGTTCARVGCMPSKLLIAAAEAAHAVAGAAQFGLSATARIDGPAVMARVRRERDRFVGFVVAETEAIPAEQRLLGTARFTGPTTLEVGDHTRVEARAVVVATGSTPFLPPPFDAVAAHVLTSDDVFELPDLPESLAVIGTGVIALELGQAMHRLGVRVAFFSPFDAVGPLTDPEVARIARRDLSAELDLRLGTTMLAAAQGAGGMTLNWRDADGTEREERFARVLVAAGRRPNIAGLGLAATGLALNRSGLPAIDPGTAQCGDAPIFLAGDVDGQIPLLHEAADDGRIAGANAMRWPAVERHDRRAPLAIAFTDPQMAMIGLRHDQLPAGEHAIGQVSFENQGRARVMGRNRGLLRVYASTRDCTLLGAEMFGPAAEHMAHLLAWSVQQRLTVPQALAMPFYHPVLEEGLRTALRDLAAQLRVLGQCRPEDLADAPGS